MELDSLDVPIKVLKIVPKLIYSTEEAHRHNYNELFFFEKGGGDHLIDFVNYKIKSQSIYSVVANKVHFVNRAIDSYGYVLMIKNDFFQNEILKSNYTFLIECEELELTEEVFSEQITLIKQICQELKTKNPLKNEVVVSIVQLMLLKLKQHIMKDNSRNHLKLSENSFYKSFYELIEIHYSTERSAQFYAERLNVSTAVLNKELKKATGKTISKLLQNRLLLEAKRLLFHSDLSIKEIGVELNFTDSAHFYHFFRKALACSPSDYRKKVKIYK